MKVLLLGSLLVRFGSAAPSAPETSDSGGGVLRDARVIAFPQPDPENDVACDGRGTPLTSATHLMSHATASGSPSCFADGEQGWELYLCDGEGGHVLTAPCSEEGCTRCGMPDANPYGYVPGVCQPNGWLMAECTQVPVDMSRFQVKDDL